MAFKNELNKDHVNSCIQIGLNLLETMEEQAKEEDLEWPFHNEHFRHGIEQKILNRSPSQTVMAAVIEYVETVEFRLNEFNGL